MRIVSYQEDRSESPKILAKFEADMSAVAEAGGAGVIVTCKACKDAIPLPQ